MSQAAAGARVQRLRTRTLCWRRVPPPHDPPGFGGPRDLRIPRALRDRDDGDTGRFDRGAKEAGARAMRTAVQAPLMNATVERFLGSAGRECLDPVSLVGERHLEHALRDYGLRTFASARPQQALAQRLGVPTTRAPSDRNCEVDAVPVLGQLHHDCPVGA